MRNIRVVGLILLFVGFLIVNPVCAMQTGQIQYTMPVDYSLIDESALNKESEALFQTFKTVEDEYQQKKMLEHLLSNYSILSKIDKENPLYFTRLGIIFDKMNKDRWAKANFCRSVNLVQKNPYAYYSFGNYYFDRFQFRKALRQYMYAFNTGYDSNYDNLHQIGKIYEKLGDFSSALLFYKKALVYNDNEELRKKITQLEGLLEDNSLYDRKRGN